jgi:hypothetical protein
MAGTAVSELSDKRNLPLRTQKLNNQKHQTPGRLYGHSPINAEGGNAIVLLRLGW